MSRLELRQSQLSHSRSAQTNLLEVQIKNQAVIIRWLPGLFFFSPLTLFPSRTSVVSSRSAQAASVPVPHKRRLIQFRTSSLSSRPAQAASASPGQARRRCLEQPAIVYAGCGAVLSDLFIGSSEGKRGGTVQNSAAKPFGMTDLRRESAVGWRRERPFQCGALSRPSPCAVKRAVHLCTHLRSSKPRFPSCLSFCFPPSLFPFCTSGVCEPRSSSQALS